MGNSQDKPADNLQNPANSSAGQISQNQLPFSNEDIGKYLHNNIKQQSPPKESIKNHSRGPSAMDKIKQKSNQNSKRNSPQLHPSRNNNSNLTKNKIQSQPQSQRTIDKDLDNEQDDNEFMPLLKLDATGEIRLRITLLQLAFDSKPKAHLKKNTSVYNSSMSWKKDPRNIFYFTLKQDQGYQLKMQVDIQGNSLNQKQWFWIVLCPINIPFGQSVKVGQMTCVNLYNKLEFDEDDQGDQDQLGPSIKNIDFKISEQTYGKWGQQVPKSFYSQPNIEAVKKVFDTSQQQKFTPYREISRYFDNKGIWRASTYFEQTLKQLKGWIIEVTDHNSIITISKQLHNDLKRRQEIYTKFMFDRVGVME